MKHGLKWHPPMNRDEWLFFDAIPKAALYVVARQLAATLNGTCDDLGPDALRTLYREWAAQFEAGNVPQKPPAFAFISAEQGKE